MNIEAWGTFFSVAATAAATLAGLIFLGISINLKKILSYPNFSNRISTSMILLAAILTFSMILLIPGSTLHTLGYIICIIGFILWLGTSIIDIKACRIKENAYRMHYVVFTIVNQIAIIPYMIAGFCMLLGIESALNWIAFAIILSFLKTLLVSWILLVEIYR